MMRAYGPIDWSPTEVRRCMAYKEFLREWDLNCDESSTLKVIGANAMIKYKKSVKKFVIAPREFVVNQIVNHEADGTIVLLGSSTNCTFHVPARSGVIRGECPISGWLIEPANKEQTKSNVYIVNEIDQKGHIPDFAVRQVMKDQGYQIDRLRKLLPKWKKRFPNDTMN